MKKFTPSNSIRSFGALFATTVLATLGTLSFATKANAEIVKQEQQ